MSANLQGIFDADLAWLSLKVWAGRGALSFGETEDGDVGIFEGDAPTSLGAGETADRALTSAHLAYHRQPGLERCDCLQLEADGDALP